MDASDVSSYAQIFVCLVLLLALIFYGPKILLDKRLKAFLAYLRVNGSSDFSFVSSGLMYFGSLLGTYNGVYVELVVEHLEAEMNGIELLLLPQLGYRSKPFLCYRLTYKGQKRYGQYQVFEALMNFSQVQEALLRDLGELQSFDSNE